MSNDSNEIDWGVTTWEGSRREQIRRWSKLTMDEILAAQEEMSVLSKELHVAPQPKVGEEPSSDSR